VVPTTDDSTPASLPPGWSTGDISDGPLPEDPTREAADAVVRDGGTYFAGQLLFGAGAAPGEDLQLRRVTQFDDAGDPAATELVDTVAADDDGEFYLRTADRDPGQYVLRGPDASGRLATVEVVAQRFGEYSARAANGTAVLTVASNRASYDLVLTATRDGRVVQPTALADAVVAPDARPVDTDAEDSLDAVLIGGFDGGDATVRIDASALPDGEYAITAGVPDATASATVTITIDDGAVSVPDDGDDREDDRDDEDRDDEFDRVWDAPLPADPTREAADEPLQDGESYVVGQVLFDGDASPGEDVQVREIAAVDDDNAPAETRLVDTIAVDDDGEYFLETGRYDPGTYRLEGTRSGRIARIDLTRQSFTVFAVREPAGGPNATALVDVASDRSSFELYLTADRDGEDVPVGTLEETIGAPDARGVDWALDKTTELDVVALDVTGGETTVRVNASALPDGEYAVRGGVPDATATGSARFVVEDGVARVPDGDDRERERDRDTDEGDDRSDDTDPDGPERIPVAFEPEGNYEQGMVLQSTDATAAAPDEHVQVRAVVGRSPLQTVLYDTVAADADGAYAVDTALLEPGEYVVRGDESGLIARVAVTAPSESTDRSTVMGVRDPDGDATVEDVDGDGRLTIRDVSVLMTMLDDEPVGAARLDVDGDGSLTVRDVAILLREVTT
jgi:hypothetical protein